MQVAAMMLGVVHPGNQAPLCLEVPRMEAETVEGSSQPPPR